MYNNIFYVSMMKWKVKKTIIQSSVKGGLSDSSWWMYSAWVNGVSFTTLIVFPVGVPFFTRYKLDNIFEMLVTSMLFEKKLIIFAVGCIFFPLNTYLQS